MLLAETALAEPMMPRSNGVAASRGRALVKSGQRTGELLAPTAPPGRVARWWWALRPELFSLSLTPLVLGLALAWLDPVKGIHLAYFHPLRALAFLLVVLFVQAGANLLNECYDAVRGTTLPSGLGGSGMIQRRLLDAETAGGAGLALLVGGAVGLALLAVMTKTWGLLWLGGVSVLLANFYSATRYALSYFPLGELVVGFLMGPGVLLTTMQVQRAPISGLAVTFALALGGLAAALLLANNLRDVETDRAANKRTLAHYVGMRVGRALYVALVLLPYLLVVRAGLPHLAPHGVLLVLLTFAGVLAVISGMLRAETPIAVHVVVTRTLRLHAQFGRWLIAGYVLSVLVLFILHEFF
jgi:1,4-dihydroxy-2-naphthoate octaprenyltransferase